jgi:hypothetical protein
MATSTTSALSLTAGSGFYQNIGITANAQFVINVDNYESLPLIANLLTAITGATTLAGLGNLSSNTLANLKSIGSVPGTSYCPALGASLPSNITANIGSVTFIEAVSNAAANTYVLGSGNFSKFAQAFSAASGYVALTNQIINSVLNSNEYLGPTFDNLDDLITGEITKINLATQALGRDLSALGELFLPDEFGTPAALLQQLSRVGNMVDGTLPAVREKLLEQGLTDEDIADLVNNNVQSLFNPNGLSEPQFDALQRQAYPALCAVVGDDLQQCLAILGVTTPNIERFCDLLDPVKIFPTSFASMTLPTPSGPVLIFDDSGNANSEVEIILEAGTITPKGCDQLAKIVGPANAVGTRALQISFSQLKNVGVVNLPQLARILA